MDFLTLCERAARSAGQVLLDLVGRVEVREKGPRDLVTQADWASQETIRGILLAEFPDHGFVSEEADNPTTAGLAAVVPEYCWVVDPLDGTTNFVHQVPHYCVSVALLHRGQPIVGTVFDPVSDELFSAARGRGASLNGRPIHTSAVRNLSEALIAASFSARVEPDSPEIAQFIAVLLNCHAARRTGSAALNLAYVAAGRFDGFWALTTHSWDVAAGVLLVEEAGGVVSQLDDRPFDLKRPHPVASANRQLHVLFRELLQNATQRR